MARVDVMVDPTKWKHETRQYANKLVGTEGDIDACQLQAVEAIDGSCWLINNIVQKLIDQTHRNLYSADKYINHCLLTFVMPRNKVRFHNYKLPVLRVLWVLRCLKNYHTRDNDKLIKSTYLT